MRLPSLIILFLITVLFIGLIEYGIHVLPPANSQGVIGDALGVATNLKRDEGYLSTLTTTCVKDALTPTVHEANLHVLTVLMALPKL